MKLSRYRVPSNQHRITLTVVNSRFITTISKVEDVEEAKSVLGNIRREMPDASHHVYAFRVGYGNSVIEGMSDDGEPSGTAGPPVLMTLRGSNIGDVLVVVTRYFGGTKLGTGGLVRAYTEATRTALDTLKTEEKVSRKTLGIEIPYALYETFKRLIAQHNGIIEDVDFTENVMVIIRIPVDDIDLFSQVASDATSGHSSIVILSET